MQRPRVSAASSSPFGRLWHYAKGHRATIYQAMTFSVLNKVFDLAPPFLIGLGIDIVVRREDSALSGLGLESPTAQFLALTLLSAVTWGLESLFQYLQGLRWRGLAQTIQHELRLDAYNHVQSLEMAYFEDESTGSLMAILNDDVNQLERFLDTGAHAVLLTLTTVVVITGVFFALAPEVAWIAMAPIPVVLWGSFWFQKKIAPRYEAVRAEVGHVNHLLANNLGGMATIKSFTSEAHETARLRGASDAYRQVNERAIRLSSAFTPLIRMVILVGFTATLVVGGWQALHGEMEVASFSLMAFLTQRLLWPLTRLGEVFDLYQRAMASTRRVLDLLGRKSTLQDGTIALPPDTVRGDLRLERLSFRYAPDHPDVLQDLDLHFPAGETTAVVGSTGSGKSTLVKLLLRTYDAIEGVVRLDGVDVRELVMRDLRRAIGLVSQDVFLFHGTVRENIAYGRLDATEAEIVEAARAAEAHAFIQALPAGYDTVVGERGQKLSGGQRQRLSIARAVLKDPPILVLDEATSAVDNETEAAIQRSMEHIAVGRTTLVIAHRLSTVRSAHNIYVLAGGRLAEHGTHDALLAQGGVYASLWRVQTGAPAATLPVEVPVLKDQLKARLMAAIKARNEVEKSILRVALGEVQSEEARRGADSTDAQVEKILRKLVKSINDSRSAAEGERLASLDAERAILEGFLPKRLGVDEIVAALADVAEAVRAAGNDGMAMGVAMKHLKGAGLAVEGGDVKTAVATLRSDSS